MSTPVFVDPESSTQADRAQRSRVPVPLPEDPYEAIRQAYLVGVDIESEPLRGRLGHLSHPTLTARMAVRVPLVMSPSLSAGMAEVVAMSDSAFRKRFRSSYDSSPSPTLPVRKRYRGTSELILGADSEEDEEVEESSDSDSESEDVEDEGPTAKDEDPATEDDGLAVRVEGPGVDDESYGLDGESHGVDDEIHSLDDESYCIDGEGRSIESDGLGLGEEEAVPEGQQRAVLVVGTAVSEPLGLGYGVLRRRELALEEDHAYSTFKPTLTTWTDPKDGMVYIEVPVYPPPAVPVQTPPSPEWTSGSLPISPSPFIVPSLVSSPMIPLTVPSPIASPMATSTAIISVDEDLFIEERTAVTFGALWRPMLALEAWAGRVDTRMTDMSRAGYDDHRLVHDMLLQQTALQRELQEMRDRVTVLE
nr:hypothetical protein [Tanacetum cinerariifolium]